MPDIFEPYYFQIQKNNSTVPNICAVIICETYLGKKSIIVKIFAYFFVPSTVLFSKWFLDTSDNKFFFAPMVFTKCQHIFLISKLFLCPVLGRPLTIKWSTRQG